VVWSGVVRPTVSRSLGHQDGGALCMKTHKHLRDEHSQAQALKVAYRAAKVELKTPPMDWLWDLLGGVS
jgi:hypothetical protein